MDHLDRETDPILVIEKSYCKHAGSNVIEEGVKRPQVTRVGVESS